MLNNVVTYGKTHKKHLLLGLIILVVLLGTITQINNDSNENGANKKPNAAAATPEYNYTYLSSDVTCKTVPAYPDAPNTVNVCSGNLNVKTETGETVKYAVTGGSHFYKDGSDTDLTQLNNLASGKSKLGLSFFAKEFGQGLNGIFYISAS